MIHAEREAGIIVGLMRWPSPDVETEEIAENHPDVLAYHAAQEVRDNIPSNADDMFTFLVDDVATPAEKAAAKVRMKDRMQRRMES